MEQRWIPVAEQMPPVETEVLITARRRYTNGTYMEIVTTAMYEDGTVLENDSCWNWIEIDGKWDEENECYIIPEGWWENRHYNPDDVYDNLVDDKVIAWMPLPEPYQGSEPHKQTNADRIRNMTDEELAAFIINFDNRFGEEYEGEQSCLSWLQAESEDEE